MPSLGHLGTRAYHTFKRLDGGFFRGRIRSVEGSQNTVSMTEARQVLETRPGAHMASGVLFYGHDNRVYLTGDRPPIADLKNTYRLFPMTRQVTVSRKGTGVNSVTGLATGTDYTDDADPVWVLMEPVSEIRDIQLDEIDVYRVVTSATLAQGDKVDGKAVLNVQTLLGVTVAEVK